MFALGLSFVERKISAPPAELGAILSIKLILHPLLVWIAVYWVFGMDGFWAFAAVLLAAMPTGALAFVLAEERDAYVAEVSAVTVLSTALSVVTISVLVLLAG